MIGFVHALVVAVVSVAVAAASGCSGDPSGTDAAVDPGRPPVLEIVAPGDSVGLAPAETVELRVRYATAEGEALTVAPVTFSLVAGVDGSGGSALSASTVATDAGGEAAVQFLAGSERVDLRVTAEAAGAQATFYINVSPGGFSELLVTPRYDGGRAVEELDHVELRLYRGTMHACADLDVDQPPVSPMAPRTLPSWDATAEWPTVNANEPYTLLVWGVHAVSGGSVSAGCVDVPATAVPPTHAELEVTVADRPVALPPQTLGTTLELAALDAALDSRGAHRPWRSLACPVGRGQLVLDWLVDALSGDGALDGITVAPTGVGATLTALRGTLGAGGCRAASGGSGASLDADLDAAIDAGDFPGGAALTLMLARRDAVLDRIAIESALEPLGPTLLEHTLISAETAAVGAPTFVLADSDRPVLTATAAPGVARPGPFVVPGHGFTLRAGSLLRASYDAFALAPVGLDGDTATLGTALVASARHGTAVGCAAVSELACDAAGQAPSCAVAACNAAAFALDGALAAWWRLADGTGIDLIWSGSVGLTDRDGDLIADPFADGAWSASLVLVDGAAIPVAGLFAAPPVTP